MAIYHLTVKTITRSKGQSAVRSAAYRHAALMYDERLGKTEDYTNKKGVVHCEITIPPNSPQWLKDLILLESEKQNIASEKLWNIVELRENQEKSQIAREIEFALPIELNQEQSINLAREFITDQFALRGMVADWSVHWDEGNPHVHVMLTMRDIQTLGFGNKQREWNNKNLLKEWRKSWAEYANFHLKLNHFDVRIDHRSYLEQGIDLIPTIHQGKAVNDMERRGIRTSIMNEANQIKLQNLRKIAEDPKCLLKKVTSQKTSFTHEDVLESMRSYITDNPSQGHIHGNKILEDINKQESLSEQTKILTCDAILKILKNIEYHDSVFSEKELAKELSNITGDPENFTRALLEVKTSKEMIYLGLGEDGRDRFTTRRMFNIETKLEILSEQVYQRKHIKISEKRIYEILKSYEKATGFVLTQEQVEAVKHITDKSSLSCMVGRAGTGKSFTLGAARAVWKSNGLNVYGVALSGVAASGLKESAGIETRTIESFNYLLKQKLIHLCSKDVVVMDEAGMTDSGGMLNILEEVHRAKAKLVLVGDPQQLQPVGPGASFRAILEKIGFCEIQTIYRQKIEWQRQATLKLAAGKVVDALQAYDENGCVHFSNTPYDTKLQVVLDFAKLIKEKKVNLSQIILVTYKNSDVSELNEMVRLERYMMGDIKEGKIVKSIRGDRKISINERLLILKNDKTLGLKNGNFATVMDINENKLTIKLDGKDDEIIIDTNIYNHFDYGYAATVHKVQGATVDHCLVYSSGCKWEKNLTYVALSRHRESCHIYTDKENYSNVHEFFNAHGKQRIKDSVLDYPLAFAQRRGLDIKEHQGIVITKHLKTRLSNLVKQIKNNFDETFNSEKYWAKKESKVKESIEAQTTLQRRHDAKLVAEYIDTNRELGKAYKIYRDKLDELGLAKLDFKLESTQFVLESKEYKDVSNLTLKRDSLAYQINKDTHRYAKALELYEISMLKLLGQAEHYLCSKKVNEYKLAKDSAKIIIRDRLAHTITQNLKGHYSQIVNLNLNIKELWQHANAHSRRSFIVGLDANHRTAFYEVENYLNLTKKSAYLINKNVKEKNVNNKAKNSKKHSYQNFMTNELYSIIVDRNQLADKILSNLEHYQSILEFHRIAINHAPNANLNIKTASIANARWSKLQQHAAKAQTMLERQQKSIEERQWLKILKRYKAINRKAGRAWSNIIKASRNEIILVDFEKRKEVAQILIAKRNYLAYQLIEGKDKILWLSEFKDIAPVDIDAHLKDFKVNIIKVNQQATQHIKQVKKVRQWQDLYEDVLYGIKQLIKLNMPYSPQTHHNLTKLLHKLELTTSHLSLNKASSYALMSINESLNRITLKVKNIGVMQKLMDQYLIQKREINSHKNIIVLNENQKVRITKANKIARNTIPISGTLAEKYLRQHRGIETKLPSSLRFHPSLFDYESGKSYPTLIAITKNCLGKIQAVQAIYLDSQTANKANISHEKKTYGVLHTGSPVVEIQKGLNSERIIVAEGIETALSIKAANETSTIYATLGASNFKHVPVTENTKSVLFCADNDGLNSPSQKLIKQASEVLALKGIDVWQIIPRHETQDFNDILRNEGVEVIRDMLNKPQLLTKGMSSHTLLHDLETNLQITASRLHDEKPMNAQGLLEFETQQAIINYLTRLDIYEKVLSCYTLNLKNDDKNNIEVLDSKRELIQVANDILNNSKVWHEIEIKSQASNFIIGQFINMKDLLSKAQQNVLTKVELNSIKLKINTIGKSRKISKTIQIKSQ